MDSTELRRIDAAVAAAMGYEVTPAKEIRLKDGRTEYRSATVSLHTPQLDYLGELPHHTTDISAAWQVVEWVRTRQWGIRDAFIGVLADIWAEWNKTAEPIDPYMSPFMWIALVVEPLTICLAFLKAMGVEVGE